MTHLLVTNDFPPKVGGIQSYLWELWRRLPAGECTVLTTPYTGAAEFDAAAPMRIVRTRAKVLLPTRSLVRQVRELAGAISADLVVLDPVLPLGRVGPRLGIPYAVVVHGAELTVPARLPGVRHAAARVLTHAAGVVAAGGYPATESQRLLTRRASPIFEVPPGVDTSRFRPLDDKERRQARKRFGVPSGSELVVSVSRLVPRKGMDTLIAAVARLAPSRPALLVAIAGIGRDRGRLEKMASRSGAPVRFMGKITDEELPLFFGAADVFVMACRNRWAGLEQEGFGVVFLEAAACGVPQIAGRSGGSEEAVEDEVTGTVLSAPHDPAELATAIEKFLADPQLRAQAAKESRRRAEQLFGYDRLALSLLGALRSFGPGEQAD